MAIPKAKFIGLSSTGPDRYGLPRNVGIKLNDKDISRAEELLKYRWFQKKPWQDEIKRMPASGLKYELDALANKDFRYLTKICLPRKLKEEDWLDWGWVQPPSEYPRKPVQRPGRTTGPEARADQRSPGSSTRCA
jgi:DNA topoisomerase-6 subunit A